MANINEVISSYNWFAPLCRCVEEEGTFKGFKKLKCWSRGCFSRCDDELPDLSEEAKETSNYTK